MMSTGGYQIVPTDTVDEKWGRKRRWWPAPFAALFGIGGLMLLGVSIDPTYQHSTWLINGARLKKTGDKFFQAPQFIGYVQPGFTNAFSLLFAMTAYIIRTVYKDNKSNWCKPENMRHIERTFWIEMAIGGTMQSAMILSFVGETMMMTLTLAALLWGFGCILYWFQEYVNAGNNKNSNLLWVILAVRIIYWIIVVWTFADNVAENSDSQTWESYSSMVVWFLGDALTLIIAWLDYGRSGTSECSCGFGTGLWARIIYGIITFLVRGSVAFFMWFGSTRTSWVKVYSTDSAPGT